MLISKTTLQKIEAVLARGDRVELIRTKNGEVAIKAVRRENIAVVPGKPTD